MKSRNCFFTRMVKDIALKALFFLLSSNLHAAEASKATVTLTKEGSGTAQLGGMSPQTSDQRFEFEFDTVYDFVVKAPEAPGPQRVSLQVRATCGVNILTRYKIKKTTKSSATSEISEDIERAWKNEGTFYSATEGYNSEGGSGSTDTGSQTFPQEWQEGVTEVMFQRSRDVPTRPGSETDPNNNSYDRSSAGMGGGSSGAPGQIIGYPPRSAKAHVTPAEPTPLLDGAACCGGVSGMSGNVELVDTSSLTTMPKMGYEIPLGGYIDAGEDSGISNGHIRIELDVLAPTNQFGWDMSSIAKVQAMPHVDYQPENYSQIIGVAPFAFIMVSADEQFTVLRYHFNDVYPALGVRDPAPVAVPLKRYVFKRVTVNGTRKIEVSHFDGNSSTPYEVNEFEQSGVSSTGWTQQWVLSKGKEMVSQMVARPTSQTLLRTNERWTKQGNLWLPQDYSLSEHKVVTVDMAKSRVFLEEATSGLGEARQRTRYTYGTMLDVNTVVHVLTDIKTYAMDSAGVEYLKESQRVGPYDYNQIVDTVAGPYSPWLNDTGDNAGEWKLWNYNPPSQELRLVHSSLPETDGIPSVKWQHRNEGPFTEREWGGEHYFGQMEQLSAFGRSGKRFRYSMYSSEPVMVEMDGIAVLSGGSADYPALRDGPGDLRKTYEPSGSVTEIVPPAYYPSVGDAPVDSTLYPARFAPYEKAVTLQHLRLKSADGSTRLLDADTTQMGDPGGSVVKEPWKTTQSTVITGKAGVAYEKEEVWNGSDWKLITDSSYIYDTEKRLASVTRDGTVVQTITHTSLLNGGVVYKDVTDAEGGVTRWASFPFTHPSTVDHPYERRLPRYAHPTSGWEAQPEVQTWETVQYNSNGSSFVTEVIRNSHRAAGTLMSTSSVKTDVGGTMIESTDEGGVVTTFERRYTDGYLTETQTTGVRSYSMSRYLDGQLRAKGGSAQPTITYDYTIQATGVEGVLETETLPGGLVNTRLRTADGEIKEEVVDGVKTVYDYDVAGRIIKKTIGTTDLKVYLMSYDYRDIVIKEGWDMNHDGQLTADSTDTLTERDQYYWLEQNGPQEQLWLVTEESVYTQAGSSPQKLTTKRREAQGMGAGAKTWITYPNGVEEHTERVLHTNGGTPDGVTTETTTSTAYPNMPKVRTYYYGRLVAFQDHGMTSPIRYLYDAFGRQTHVIDPRSSLAQVTTYDATTGRVTSSTNAAGEATTYGYQSTDGLLDWADNPVGVRTDYGWSTAGLLASVGGDGAYPVSYQYNAAGRLGSITTAVAGDERVMTWGANGLQGRTFGGGAGSVSYLYWPDGLLKQRQWGASPNTITTLYTYDSAGRLAGVNHDDATLDVTYAYDRAGRLASQTDGSGERSLVHETDGTLTESVTSGLLSGLSITKRVNAAGQTMALEWSFAGVNGKAGYAYADGRLASASLLAASASSPSQPLVTASYDYHANSAHVHHLTRPIEAGTPLVGTFTVDAVGRPDTLSWQRGTAAAFEEIDYTLDAAGRRWKEARKDDTTLEYTYNTRGELSDVVRRRANGSLRPDWTHGYEYDASGNRTLTETPEGESQARTWTTYPAWSQAPATKSWLRGRAHPQAVVTVNGSGVGSTSRDGELWRALVPSQSGKAAQVTVNASRTDLSPAQYAGLVRRVVPGQALSSGESVTRIDHDWNGNVTDDGRWTYQWDAERRPVVMEEKFLGLTAPHYESSRPVKRLEMVYDAQGRRVSKKVLTNTRNANGTLVNTTWTFESETLFLWQDWTLLAEFVKLTPSGTPQLRRTYLWGLDVNGTLGGAGGVGGLLWVADHVPNQLASNRQLAPWYDGNGNILGWMENEGAELLPLHRIEYDPFGRTLVDDPVRVARNKKQRDMGVTNEWLDRPPFGFSTKYEDRETGLLYYGYRYYSPELGRWLSRDPIDEHGGLNLYGMCYNNLANWIDRLGLKGSPSSLPATTTFAPAGVPSTVGPWTPATPYESPSPSPIPPPPLPGQPPGFYPPRIAPTVPSPEEQERRRQDEEERERQRERTRRPPQPDPKQAPCVNGKCEDWAKQELARRRKKGECCRLITYTTLLNMQTYTGAGAIYAEVGVFAGQNIASNGFHMGVVCGDSKSTSSLAGLEVGKAKVYDNNIPWGTTGRFWINGAYVVFGRSGVETFSQAHLNRIGKIEFK